MNADNVIRSHIFGASQGETTGETSGTDRPQLYKKQDIHKIYHSKIKKLDPTLLRKTRRSLSEKIDELEAACVENDEMNKINCKSEIEKILDVIWGQRSHYEDNWIAICNLFQSGFKKIPGEMLTLQQVKDIRSVFNYLNNSEIIAEDVSDCITLLERIGISAKPNASENDVATMLKSFNLKK